MLPVNTLHPVRKPMYVTYGLIAVNALVFIWQLTLPPAELYRSYMALALVPCQVASSGLNGEVLLDTLRSLFMHGGWIHLAGNMTFLWIFGRNVEEYFGHVRFLVLYLVWGAIAAAAQVVVTSNQCVPNIGASGAIAGVLGSYLILYPGTRIRVLIIWFRFFPRFYHIPALVVLGYWFVLQLFNGLLSLNTETLGGVGYFAHIGGFIGGLVLAFIYTMFNPPPRRVTYVD